MWPMCGVRGERAGPPCAAGLRWARLLGMAVYSRQWLFGWHACACICVDTKALPPFKKWCPAHPNLWSPLKGCHQAHPLSSVTPPPRRGGTRHVPLVLRAQSLWMRLLLDAQAPPVCLSSSNAAPHLLQPAPPSRSYKPPPAHTKCKHWLVTPTPSVLPYPRNFLLQLLSPDAFAPCSVFCSRAWRAHKASVQSLQQRAHTRRARTVPHPI